MRTFLKFIWEVANIVVIAALIVIPIRLFVFQPFFVRGDSMEPSSSNGDYLIVDELSYKFRAPERGEIIVFRYPEDPSKRFIKRIVGLPGEIIEITDGTVNVYEGNTVRKLVESYLHPGQATEGDVRVELGSDEYFVLGDNRPFSFDSRRFGTLGEDHIIGKVLVRVWPVVAFATFEAPVY